MSVNDSGDESNWTTFWTKVWRGEGINLKGPEALEYIRQNTEPLRDVFQWAVDWTPADSTVHINEMKYWSPIAWENLGGRVTLAGDAAHPMLICMLFPPVESRGAAALYCLASHCRALLCVASKTADSLQFADKGSSIPLLTRTISSKCWRNWNRARALLQAGKRLLQRMTPSWSNGGLRPFNNRWTRQKNPWTRTRSSICSW